MISNKDLKNTTATHPPFDGGNIAKGLQLAFIVAVFALVTIGFFTV